MQYNQYVHVHVYVHTLLFTHWMLYMCMFLAFMTDSHLGQKLSWQASGTILNSVPIVLYYSV